MYSFTSLNAGQTHQGTLEISSNSYTMWDYLAKFELVKIGCPSEHKQIWKKFENVAPTVLRGWTA